MLPGVVCNFTLEATFVLSLGHCFYVSTAITSLYVNRSRAEGTDCSQEKILLQICSSPFYLNKLSLFIFKVEGAGNTFIVVNLLNCIKTSQFHVSL